MLFQRMKLAIGLSLLLGGCAATPRLVVEAKGAFPDRGSFEIAAPPDKNDARWARAVVDMAERLGLSQSQPSAYIMEFSRSVRSSAIKLVLEGAEGEAQSPLQCKGGRQRIFAVSLDIWAKQDGRGVYRSSASRCSSSDFSVADWQALFDAVMKTPDVADGAIR